MIPEVSYNDNAGELTLCGTDPAHYKGQLVWAPVVVEKYWQIEMGPVYVGRTPVTNGTTQAIVDTGTSIIVGPPDVIQEIVQQIGANTTPNNLPTVDCKAIRQLPPITFNIACRSFVLHGPDYIVQVVSRCQFKPAGALPKRILLERTEKQR
ncbi:eukaryotic aspartyl protease [Teladorsagia circumcincta]|uniref:Eukaryotic aspartyl protease n=1 Tax=Teladorsagia circumcincta TaxID=45464 RepID=A0A2G9UZC2_TELCI|nr:eukaryotic aspartyl protease [Teladorsagia circumcincta]